MVASTSMSHKIHWLVTQHFNFTTVLLHSLVYAQNYLRNYQAIHAYQMYAFTFRHPSAVQLQTKNNPIANAHLHHVIWNKLPLDTRHRATTSTLVPPISNINTQILHLQCQTLIHN